MRRATLLSSAAALLILGTSAYAQTPAAAPAKPNFAGKWVILPDSAGAAAVPGLSPGGRELGGLGDEATIAQDDKSFTLTRSGPDGTPFISVFNLDGSETHQSISAGGGSIDLTLKGRWNDKQFQTSTWVNVQGQGFEILLSFTLNDKGQLVTEHTTPNMGNMGGGTMTTKYKKGS